MIPVIQFVAAFLPFSRVAVAPSSDPAPEGFRWQRVEEIKASFARRESPLLVEGNLKKMAATRPSWPHRWLREGRVAITMAPGL